MVISPMNIKSQSGNCRNNYRFVSQPTTQVDRIANIQINLNLITI
jgi:hypothetical protein